MFQRFLLILAVVCLTVSGGPVLATSVFIDMSTAGYEQAWPTGVS